MHKVSKYRVALLCVSTVLAFLAAFFREDFFVVSDGYKSVVSTLFTTFIGFLIAVFTLIPLASKFNRADTTIKYDDELKARRTRLSFLFFIYFGSLIILGLAESVRSYPLKEWFLSAFFCLSVFGLSMSLELPRLLTSYAKQD